MPTPAQEAFAEGFSDLADAHGTPCAIGAVVFTGVASVLKPNDPRMIGSMDRLIEITAKSASVPAIIKVGTELTRDGRKHRVTRSPDVDAATGLTSILVTA